MVRVYTYISRKNRRFLKKARKNMKAIRIMYDLGDILAGVATTGLNDIVGGGLGLALQGINNANQISQQQKLTNIQTQAQENLSQFNEGEQVKLWNDTGYGPQVAQMEAAGLNPALMYGKGGGGGQTAALQTGSVSGGMAAQQTSIPEMIGLQLQSQQQQAEIRNKDAQTELIKAQIPNVAKTGANIDASTNSLTQGIKNQQAQQALTEAQTRMENVATSYEGATLGDRIDMIGQELQIQRQVLQQQIIQSNLDQATYKDKVKIANANAVGAILNNANVQADTQLKGEQGQMIQSNMKLNDAERSNMSAKIVQGYAQLSNDAWRIQTEKDLREEGFDVEKTDQLIEGISKVLGFGLMTQGAPGRNVIQGFKKSY